MRQVKIGAALRSGAVKGRVFIGALIAPESAGTGTDVIAGFFAGARVGTARASRHLPVLTCWVRTFSDGNIIRPVDSSWLCDRSVPESEKVTAVDRQHDTHLTQQILLSTRLQPEDNNAGEKKIDEFLPLVHQNALPEQ